jgi:polygalacturonase
MKMGAQGLGVLWACVAMISIGVDAGVVRATTQHVELDRIQGLATGATGATGAATGARNPHPDGVQRGTDTGTNSLQMTARNPPTNASGTPTALGLNVKDFGAVGDGVTDDVAAIQTAIDASSNQSRALLFPAGT